MENEELDDLFPPSLEFAFYLSYFWFRTQSLTQRDYLINIVVLVDKSNDAMNSSKGA